MDITQKGERSPVRILTHPHLRRHVRRLLAAGALCLASAAHALTVYSLEAGAFASQPEADDLRGKLSASMGPVFVETDASETNRPFKVRVGHIPYHAEAWVFQSLLNQSELPACTIVAWEWDGRQLEPTRLPLALPFDPALLRSLPRNAECRMDYETPGKDPAPESLLKAIEASDLSTLTDQELLERVEYLGTLAAKIESVEFLLVSRATSPLVNKARLRLTRLYFAAERYDEAAALIQAVRNSGQPSERSAALRADAYMVLRREGSAKSLPAFTAIANNGQAEATDRLDAMLRVAAIGQALRDYPAAWLANTQIEKAVDAPRVLAQARMKKASIAFELMGGSNPGNWDEVRTLCRLADDTPNSPPNDRATARLMYAETFLRQKDYPRALREMEGLVADYPAQNRERATALFWKARCLQQMGDAAGAGATFDAVLADPAAPKDLFAKFNVKARAYLEQARLASQQGEHERALELLALMDTVSADSGTTPSAAARP